MKWLTQKQIIAAAKKSDLAALECCKVHWTQFRDASFEEIVTARRTGRARSGYPHCACCRRFDRDHVDCYEDQSACPLFEHDDCCGGRYEMADDMHKDIVRQREVSEERWQSACQSLIDFIASKIKEEKAK